MHAPGAVSGHGCDTDFHLQVFDAGQELLVANCAAPRDSVSAFTRNAGQPGRSTGCSRRSRCAPPDPERHGRDPRVQARGRPQSAAEGRRSQDLANTPAAVRGGAPLCSARRGATSACPKWRVLPAPTRWARNRARLHPDENVVGPLHGHRQLHCEVPPAVMNTRRETADDAHRGRASEAVEPACSMSGTSTESACRAASCRRARLSLAVNPARQRCRTTRNAATRNKPSVSAIMSSGRLKPRA